MAKKTTALVTFLLDRSGSMAGIKEATILGFNEYLNGLKKDKKSAIDFTLLQFDTASIDKLHVAVPVAKAEERTNANFQPRGGTPLIDACVTTIHAVAASLEKRADKPKVVVCFQTDGHENASTENTWENLKALIKAKQEEGWEFNFMGAGIDAYEQASQMGIGAGSTMSYDAEDVGATTAAFAASSRNTRSYVSGQSTSTAYTARQKRASGDKYDPATLKPAPASRAPLDLTTRSAGGGGTAGLDLTKP